MSEWPYGESLQRLVLALALGLLVGMERERRHKQAGLRTFAFAALIGELGGVLGAPFALASLAMVGLLVTFINIRSLMIGRTTELTTSTALMVLGFAGVLCGSGHTLTPTAVAIGKCTELAAWS